MLSDTKEVIDSSISFRMWVTLPFEFDPSYPYDESTTTESSKSSISIRIIVL
jgi:hypothetical protein